MNSRSSINRRGFLRATSVGATALFTGTADGLLSAAAAAAVSADHTLPAGSSPAVPDVEFALRVTPAQVPLFPGAPTRVWSYQATLLRGSTAALQTLPGSYLGPVIRARRGQKLRVHFLNDLPEPSIIHWHGLRVPPAMDGHPRDAVGPGRSYTYEFEVSDRAGTYWYHPHPHQRTGPQVYAGLAGLFLVTDDEEEAAGLPTGAYDVPLVIQDRLFDRSNQLVYETGGMMIDRTMGFLGDRILVNGQPDPTLTVATRPYRLRLLNGSNFRIYKLAWSDGTPMTVIGTDNGLLETPVSRSYVTLAPGERVELWADFSGRSLGSTVRLQSLAFSGVEGEIEEGGDDDHDGGMEEGGHGDHGGTMPGGVLTHGAPFSVLTVQIAQKVDERLPLPARLSTLTRHRREDAVNRERPRLFELSFWNMRWLINGRSFEMEQVADNEIVQQNTTEVWELVNQTSPGQMVHAMGMAHPLHIHGVQFQVLERQVLPELAAGWETVRHGYVDEGWKDTVLLMPGERVKLLVRFDGYPGLYVYHCHNLEHEDGGMMRNYLIRA